MHKTNYNDPWYHGSPEKLFVLKEGSWVTQFKEMAKAFSHRPSLISLDDSGEHVKHNGRSIGYLYTISETVEPDDVCYLPNTAQTHWQTKRELELRLIAKLPTDDPPQLNEEEIAELRKDIPEGTTGFVGAPDREPTTTN